MAIFNDRTPRELCFYAHENNCDQAFFQSNDLVFSVDINCSRITREEILSVFRRTLRLITTDHFVREIDAFEFTVFFNKNSVLVAKGTWRSYSFTRTVKIDP